MVPTGGWPQLPGRAQLPAGQPGGASSGQSRGIGGAILKFLTVPAHPKLCRSDAAVQRTMATGGDGGKADGRAPSGT